MKPDYNRNLPMICPTCAATDFRFDETEEPTFRSYTSIGCATTFSHEEILEGNQSRIEAAAEEIKSEVLGDVKRDWSKLFNGR